MNLHQPLPSAMLGSLFAEYSHDHLRGQVILMDQKFIWALCFDTPGCQCVGRKILEVEGNDRLRSAGYGRRKNMAVFGLICHCLHERTVSFHPGIGEVNLQLTEQMRRLLRSQTQLDFESPLGFFDDVPRPARAVRISPRTRLFRVVGCFHVPKIPRPHECGTIEPHSLRPESDCNPVS